MALRKRGFENQVISFDGLVRVLPGARIGTIAPTSIKTYDKAMGLLDKVMSEMQNIVVEQSAYLLELQRVFEQTFPDNDFGEDFSGEENVDELTQEEAAELAAALEGLAPTAEDAQEEKEKETEERGESSPIPEAALETKPRDDSPTGWAGAKVTGDPDEQRRYNEKWEERTALAKERHAKVMAFTEKLFKAAQEHVNASYDAK